MAAEQRKFPTNVTMANGPSTDHLLAPTRKYILNKYVHNKPSLIVHLHQNHWKFDAQDDYFLYTAPMRFAFLEHLQSRTVPHDMVAELTEGGVPFYEGCLIVEVHDHKLVAAEKEQEARPSSRSKQDIPSSIHKYSPWVTPSPSRPFPQDATLIGNTKKSHLDQRDKPAGSADQGSPSASSSPQAPKSKTPSKSTVYTAVLFPTHQSRQADLAVKACNPRGSIDSRQDGAANGIPPTPSVAVPPTPTGSSMPPPSKKVKRERMELDSSNIYAAEGAMLLATLPPLDLEPTKDALGTIIKLEEQAAALEHRFNPPPKPKTRKRTVAEMAADEAQAAENERFLLTLDDRSGQGGSSVPGGDGQQQAAPFEPSFDRFKKIEDIKREHAERAKQEKIKAAEKERQLHETKLQQQAQQQAALQQQQAEEARNRQEQAARAQQEEINRRKQHQMQQQQQQQRLQAQAAAQAQAAQAQQFANMSQNSSHGHPPMQNGQVPVSAPMAHARLQGGASQPAASSPMVRQSTPQNIMSSPMVGGVPMQPSGSSVGVGSPARPPSVVNQGVPMSVAMSARGSQQSHQSGTPRIPQGTPNMAHATPMSRPQMSNNPPGPNMQMSPAQIHNSNLAMQHAQLQAQQRARQQQILLQQNGMMPQNPQQMQQMQMQQNFIRQQQARMQMANGGQQQNQAMIQQYRAQMLQAQAQRAAQAQSQGGQYANQQAHGPNQAQMQQMQFAAAAAAAQHQQQQNPQAAMIAQQQQLEAAQRLAQNGGGHPGAQAQSAQMAVQQQFARAVQMQATHFYRNGLASWLQSRGLTQETASQQELQQFKSHCMANAQNMLMQRRQQAAAAGGQTGFNMGHGFGQ